jgi:hypothetical protein
LPLLGYGFAHSFEVDGDFAIEDEQGFVVDSEID